MFTFDIAQWRAWAPGLSSSEAWQRWYAAPFIPPATDEAPDVSFLPPLQRRRLGRLARMVFHVAWSMAEGYDRLPFVFVSRHGETPRTFEMLRDLAAAEPLSPTQFSLSVHNAVVGLWSILRNQPCEMSAIAAEFDGLEHGLLEAATLLEEGAPAVLLVVAEERPPAAYAACINDVPFPYALGLLIVPGERWSLVLEPLPRPADDPALPHGLSLLGALAAGKSQVRHPCKERLWTWQRRS